MNAPRVLAALALSAAACGGRAADPTSLPPATAEQLAKGRAELAELRAGEPRTAYGLRVRVKYRTPNGATMDGRGGIAVDPHRAMRMILVGPGGATAIDAWVTRDRWRFEVPALDKVTRGEADVPRGLPVGFFRWWFLAPLEGKLLTVQGVDDRGGRLIVKEDGAVVDLREAHEPPLVHLTATRRANGATEIIDWRGQSLTPAAGDRASYLQPESGLRIDVVVEAVSAEAPPAAAFDDPDLARAAETQL